MTSFVDQRRKAHEDFQAGTKRDKTNRFATAGRLIFYVAVAPLLLCFGLIGLIWVAGQAGLIG